MTIQPWGFYGRDQELNDLLTILQRNKWFFVKITGRRRIGKTSLVQKAMEQLKRDRLLYIQIPDSDPAGVLSVVREFYESFGLTDDPPTSLFSLAASIGKLARAGWVIAIDEFQYFHRKVLYEFTSHLQYEVDQLTKDAHDVKGGLIVLGSIHTEMSALLENRSAPLFARITNQFDLPHLDIASVLKMLRLHADDTPERLLFLWNLFEGVPKFYRDSFEEGVLGSERRQLLGKMFFSSASPLRTEADNWFLKEFRGRYDLVLKYIARHPGCTNAELSEYARSVEPEEEKQVAGYVSILSERYRMIDRLLPIFSRPTARRNRFYLKDNFLRSWLAALAVPAASVNFRPVEQAVVEADKKLMEAEGYGLERLVWALYEERSRKGLGDFPLTSRMQGYWDRADTEIDLVALNETDKVIRLGTCKRNAEKLDYPSFEGHVGRFLEAFPKFKDWKVEKAAVATIHTRDTRKMAADNGCMAQDLVDLTKWL